jgi:hypothetical protein
MYKKLKIFFLKNSVFILELFFCQSYLQTTVLGEHVQKVLQMLTTQIVRL